MIFKRLEILSKEADIISGILNNESNVSFQELFDLQDDLTEINKLDKICEMIYKVFKTANIEDTSNLLNMFDDSKVGDFCIKFIKMNLELDKDLEERLNELLELDCDVLPPAQIKIDYLQLTLNLLLNQEHLNLELINQTNNKLKALMAEINNK